MLLLLLMIVIVRISPFTLAQELRATGKPFEHSHEHFNDVHKLLFRGNNSLCSDELSHYEHVKTGSAFQRRTTSDFQKSGAIRTGKLSVSIGNVERQACGRAIELIFGSRFCGNLIQQITYPTAECDRFLVNVEVFVVEVSFHTWIMSRSMIMTKRGYLPKSSSNSTQHLL